MRRGALRGILLRLAAGVAGGALRLEHLPPEILAAQQGARDLLVAGETAIKSKRDVPSFFLSHGRHRGTERILKVVRVCFREHWRLAWTNTRWRYVMVMDTHCSGVWGGLLEM